MDNGSWFPLVSKDSAILALLLSVKVLEETYGACETPCEDPRVSLSDTKGPYEHAEGCPMCWVRQNITERSSLVCPT